MTGLRREEVAMLADISTDYYTRLEQGRSQPSGQVLAALAQALHLDDSRRDHLFELAARQDARPRRQAAQKVRPALRRLLDDLTAAPGVVMGRRMEILAWNPLAAALFTDFAKVPERKRNYVHLLFSDPSMRALHADWRTVARDCVSHLRMRAAKYPDDPRLNSLVGELSVRDKDFGQWWGGRHTASRGMGTKRLRHPVAGELVLDWDTLTCGTDPIRNSWSGRRSPALRRTTECACSPPGPPAGSVGPRQAGSADPTTA